MPEELWHQMLQSASRFVEESGARGAGGGGEQGPMPAGPGSVTSGGSGGSSSSHWDLAERLSKQLAVEETSGPHRRDAERLFFAAVGGAQVELAQQLFAVLREQHGLGLADVRDDFLQRNVLHVLVTRHYCHK
jgi:hypothetical protein